MTRTSIVPNVKLSYFPSDFQHFFLDEEIAYYYLIVVQNKLPPGLAAVYVLFGFKVYSFEYCVEY